MQKNEVDIYLEEIKLLKGLVLSSSEAVAEELNREIIQLVAKVNRLLGTEHIAAGSTISVVN